MSDGGSPDIGNEFSVISQEPAIIPPTDVPLFTDISSNLRDNGIQMDLVPHPRDKDAFTVSVAPGDEELAGEVIETVLKKRVDLASKGFDPDEMRRPLASELERTATMAGLKKKDAQNTKAGGNEIGEQLARFHQRVAQVLRT